MLATLDWTDESDLIWYFGVAQTLFERSTAGALVERGKLYGLEPLYGSDGAPLLDEDERPKYGPRSWAPGTERLTDAQGKFYGTRELETMIVRETFAANRKEPDRRALERYARISRRLLLLPEKMSRAFELLFGDFGGSFVAQRLDADDHPLDPLRGLDRMCALYHETKAGKAWLERCELRRKKKGEPDLGLSDGERMYQEVVAYLREAAKAREEAEKAREAGTEAPESPPRVEAFGPIRAQAQALFNAAVIAWKRAAPPSEE